MNNKPIGVFDSGLGGLTCVKRLRELLPNEDIVYLGDTGRVPYGSRSKETINRFASDDIAFLESMGVKLIVAACATVSSVIEKRRVEGMSVPFLGVINSAAIKAASLTKGSVGVIGTSATVNSLAFPKAIAEINEEFKVQSVACPIFVPLVENGFFDEGNLVAIEAIKHYLKDMKDVDTLILGCTHYPLLRSNIQAYMPSAILVDSGAEVAHTAKEYLKNNSLLSDRKEEGSLRCFVSDSVESFNKNASLFLGKNEKFTTQYISLENLGTL